MSVESAVRALREGKLVILPTETVYGLAADATNPEAVAKIYKAKGRPQFNPLIAHVPTLEAAKKVAVLDRRAIKLAQAFWPGPLTIVAKARKGAVCDLARAGLDTVAVRVPRPMLARGVLQAFGKPVVAPSANRSGRPSPTTCEDAVEETGEAAAVVLDGGPARVGLESTVVGLNGKTARLLRPGAVTRAQIEALIGPLADAEADAKRAPGRVSVHYAPDAPVRLNAAYPREGEAFLGFGAGPDTPFNLSRKGDVDEAAANLFSMLRAADKTKPTAIAVAPVPEEGLGEAINDRLRRAAGHVG